jgi:4-carboxymuconolactone decarboxylase
VNVSRDEEPLLPLVEAPQDAVVGEMFERLAAANGVLNLHRMMAHAPPLLKASSDMARVFRQEAVLSRALAELVVLRIAQLMDCPYVFVRHLPLARAAGVAERQIEEIGRWRDSGVFTPAQKAAFGFAEGAARGIAADQKTAAALRRDFSPREIVELAMLVGYYVSTALFIKSMSVPKEV